jgi:hypothetical protein
MNWMTAIAINLLVPLLGVVIFALLCRKMRRTHVPAPPFFSYFVLFATFGGWLMVCLTALFWKWSGLASLGVFSLILVAPFVTAGMAFTTAHQNTHLSMLLKRRDFADWDAIPRGILGSVALVRR